LPNPGRPLATHRSDPDVWRRFGWGSDRHCDRIAVDIDAGDLDHGGLRQGIDRRQASMLAAFDAAGPFDVLDQAFEGDAVGGSDLEGAHDLALADRDGAGCDEGEDILAAGHSPGRAPGQWLRPAQSPADRRTPADFGAGFAELLFALTDCLAAGFFDEAAFGVAAFGAAAFWVAAFGTARLAGFELRLVGAPFADCAARRAMAAGNDTSSGVNSLGSVALTPAWLT
jgi:hypothetical protein